MPLPVTVEDVAEKQRSCPAHRLALPTSLDVEAALSAATAVLQYPHVLPPPVVHDPEREPPLARKLPPRSSWPNQYARNSTVYRYVSPLCCTCSCNVKQTRTPFRKRPKGDGSKSTPPIRCIPPRLPRAPQLLSRWTRILWSAPLPRLGQGLCRGHALFI
ncbi:hypothetical protein K438DRAFT_2019552, partial [Mycena galopus ATCC 62051]